MTPPRRILIVRLGSMGDIVHALPLLASLRAEWPDAEVDWLVDRRHRALLDLVPGIATRIIVDTREVIGQAGWVRTLRALQARRYEVAIDAQGLIKSALLARGARPARVVGFARPHVREAAASWLYTTAVDPGASPHVVDMGLALARAAGVANPVKVFGLQVPDPTPVVSDLFDRLGRFVLLNPGGAWPNKRWPADRFGRLAQRVHARHGLRTLVPWGPGEEAVAAAVVEAAPEAAILAPRTSLHDLVAVVARAALVVAGDTGPLHLAGALGRPVVGIYGPTNPARNGPWGAADRTVSRHDRCECFHKRTCRAARWCLDDVDVDEVYEAVAERLAAEGA